jgi:hypothetical protein
MLVVDSTRSDFVSSVALIIRGGKNRCSVQMMMYFCSVSLSQSSTEKREHGEMLDGSHCVPLLLERTQEGLERVPSLPDDADATTLVFRTNLEGSGSGTFSTLRPVTPTCCCNCPTLHGNCRFARLDVFEGTA